MTISPNGDCLKEEDLYSYLTASPKAETDSKAQLHLSACSQCRQELAGLIRVLHPEPGDATEAAEQPSPEEIRNTLAFIHKVSDRKPYNKRWYRWGAVAAAAAIAIGLSSAGFLYLYLRTKSQDFYSQARSLLQQVYEPRSPSGLRLDLPFRSEVYQRADPSGEAMTGAEKLLNQALGVREGMSEALLGLGYLHLQKNQFKKAEAEFQAVLDARSSNLQALLARGVSRFEEGSASTDPTARRTYLGGALQDFESVLKLNPGSNEARFNKVRALYEMGRHKQALQEIDVYLARDSDSIWAVKLRDLKIRIQMNRAEVLEKEVRRAPGV